MKVVVMVGSEYEVHDDWQVVLGDVCGVAHRHPGRAMLYASRARRQWWFQCGGRPVVVSNLRARLLMASHPAEVEARHGDSND